MLIDYVVEDELPLLKELARKNNAKLFYVVLTATEEGPRLRLTNRGNRDLIERSLFLKSKLDAAPENRSYLYNISGKTVAEEAAELDMTKYEVPLY